MTRRAVLCAALVLACVPMGCGEKPAKLTPEQIIKICDEGGQAAALAWVAAAKPSADQITQVKFVLDEISAAMASYQGEGFIGMLPQINEVINATIKGEDERAVALRKLAHLLASNALVSLDDLFYKHPDWEKKGAQASQYVAAFTSGASKALDTNVVTMRAAEKKAAPPAK